MEKLTDIQIERLLRNRGISKKVITLIPGLLHIQRALIQNKENQKKGIKRVKIPRVILLEVAGQTVHAAHDNKITIYQSKVIVDLSNQLLKPVLKKRKG